MHRHCWGVGKITFQVIPVGLIQIQCSSTVVCTRGQCCKTLEFPVSSGKTSEIDGLVMQESGNHQNSSDQLETSGYSRNEELRDE